MSDCENCKALSARIDSERKAFAELEISHARYKAGWECEREMRIEAEQRAARLQGDADMLSRLCEELRKALKDHDKLAKDMAAICDISYHAPELGSNYNDDDVRRLNQAMCDLYLIAESHKAPSAPEANASVTVGGTPYRADTGSQEDRT